MKPNIQQAVPGTIVLAGSQVSPSGEQGPPGLSAPSIPIVFMFSGKPAASASVNVPIAVALDIPANFVGSLGYVEVTPSADYVFTISRLNTSWETEELGTLTIRTTGQPIFAGNGGLLAIGDILKVIASATADSTLSNVSISILTNRA